MPRTNPNILAINPGSTSTKIAVYCGAVSQFARTVRHADGELAVFRGKSILEQTDFRQAVITRELEDSGFCVEDLDAVAGRGGLLHPIASGTYRVNEAMLAELREAKRGEHAANLGAFLAKDIADRAKAHAYIVDPVSVDEWPPCARLSGSPLVERQSLSHALNTKAAAKRYAGEQAKNYNDLRLIVAHMGSGTSISAHEGGRMIDVADPSEEGPFSAERAGSLPVRRLVQLCFNGKLTQAQIEDHLLRTGGLYAYLGTKNLEEIERRIAAGDAYATLVYDAMAYQISKEIGAMAAVLHGRVDAVLLTGGMAHSKMLTTKLQVAVQWIAAVAIYPGEDELQALAEGVLRVWRGEEAAIEFLPAADRELVASAAVSGLPPRVYA